MKELDELLKENLLPDCVPEKSLNASIVKKAKETQNMKHRTLKSGVAAAAAIGILVVGSASAYAAYRYLTPSQVADQMTEDGALAKAFENVPPKKEIDSVTLEDDESLRGRTLISYSYGNVKEHETNIWVEMFKDVIKQIYDEDPSQIRILASDKNYENIIISSTEKQGDWFKIDTDIYLYTHNSTNAKMRILNKVFDAYGKDKNDLVFNLKPEK